MVQVTSSNKRSLFNSISQSEPRLRSNMQDLFNKVSRVHNMKGTACKLDESKIGKTQKIDRDGALSKSEKNEYQHEVAPGGVGENKEGLDVMLYYPFIIMVIWMVAMCIFCRPIRRMFKCKQWMNRLRIKAGYTPLYPTAKRGKGSMVYVAETVSSTPSLGREARN